jgi:ribonucleoside-triphosphate reductase
MLATAAPEMIVKRDGSVVAFDPDRITNAVTKCFSSLPERPTVGPITITEHVINVLGASSGDMPTVEKVQDLVEVTLQSMGLYDAAKHYILYRADHDKQREGRPVPEEVKAAYAEADQYFPTPIQKFQFFDKYSRFDYGTGRRETWIETVDRAVGFLRHLVVSRTGVDIGNGNYHKIRQMILEMKAMPSMRLLAMAGEAAKRDNSSIYNCTYLPVDSIDSFAEGMLLSMAGCGVGFSVENMYVEKFQRVKRQKGGSVPKLVIPDTTQGWAWALRVALEAWFDGDDVEFDYSELRPAGTPLRIKGGRSSGPGPLRDAMLFMRGKILARQGSFLRPIDAHDIMCMVGVAAVSGGVRRNAMISLFDYDDLEMRLCKSGDFERENKQRWNSNNSAVWPDRGLSQMEIIEQTVDMVRSQRGEPGIFNRAAAVATMPERRRALNYQHYGTNPCGEIVLREYGMCNLSIAVARSDDNLESLSKKVMIASVLGTIQSLATHFPDLRPIWSQNCEEERLLGVDITGQRDCPAVQDPQVMQHLRNIAVETNKAWAELLGINQSASVTCVKPSGNSAQLLDCSSGIHPRWAPYYERNARVSATSPVCKVLRDAGVPMDPENSQTVEDANTWVVHFPVKAPDGAITRHDVSAIDQCNYWLMNKKNWTTHNPSVTITYKPDEIADLIKWICDNKDLIGGMAFLPSYDAQYAQLPNIEITQEEYELRAALFPNVDYSKLWRYENSDLTTVAQEIACMSGQCELEL